MLEFKTKCHWHDFVCEDDRMCTECPHCPKDEEKPNYHKPRLKAEDDGWGMPICPSCWEFTYDYKRCFFCGQEIKVKRSPNPLIVGWRDYKLMQLSGTTHSIYVFKEGREVLHAQCSKDMTPKEARRLLKSIPKCFRAISEEDTNG